MAVAISAIFIFYFKAQQLFSLSIKDQRDFHNEVPYPKNSELSPLQISSCLSLRFSSTTASPTGIHTPAIVRHEMALRFGNIQERPSPLNHFFPKHKPPSQQRKVVFFHLHNSCYFKSIL